MNAILFMIPLFAVALLTAQPTPAHAAPNEAPAALPADATQADRLWKEATAALDARRYQDAQQPFDEFIRRYSADPRAREAQILSALCDYRRKRVVQAIETWNRIVRMELMSRNASPALRLGLTHLAAHFRADGKTADWAKTVDRLFEFFPEDSATILECRLYAQEQLNRGEFFLAVSAYERIGKQLTAEDRQNLDLARAMTDSGADGQAIVELANARLAGNQPDLAARLYREALKKNLQDDERLEAMTKLGWCLYLRDAYQDAEPLWRQVIQGGAKGNEWVGRSRWHLIQLFAGPRHQAKQAIELCEAQAIEFTGSFLGRQAAFTKAWLYWVARDWDKALQAFHELARAYPDVMEHEPVRNYIRECEQGLNAGR